MNGSHVPPGYSPPFQVVDDKHHGAWIIITAALGLVISLVSFLIRLYVRLVLNPPFAVDDFVLLGATIVAIIQSSLIFGAVSLGFGTSITLVDHALLDRIQTLVTLGDLLYIITVYVSKCCVVGIHLRLTPQKWHNRASWATLVLCTAWALTAVCMIAINCEFNRPWTADGVQCSNFLVRWKFIVSMDILTELILFGLAVVLLAGLFMPLKKKLTIGFAFFSRLPLILFSIFNVHTLNRNYYETDPTLSAVGPTIWSQVELNYALVTCSVFVLRPFMAAVSTNYGTAGDSNLESTRASRTPKDGSNAKTGSGSGSGTGTPATATVAEQEEKRTWSALRAEKRLFKAHARLRSEESAPGSAATRPGRAQDDAIELVERGGSRSAGSDGSQKMFIRKDVQYSVEYKRKKSDGDVPSETEYWDRYLDQRP
ncbi:hypothetical protein ATEIFO6365_0003072000 [Aspergillus terreus]|uniref:Rhodopsin domain-containing protein n=1 Tax=Aspergillus terreus TaxID=33178 RepID=A0A5M3YSD7_ASPTE|nr:hypothetical protein ATETN484_0003066600 [Aspergillus terreus]GFF14652.1 hypothetical protein ATEIFO6365_0003072000 [Aspergillus terreus]